VPRLRRQGTSGTQLGGSHLQHNIGHIGKEIFSEFGVEAPDGAGGCTSVTERCRRGLRMMGVPTFSKQRVKP
jgi:hypothetical protein